jgi:hypothetical protein
MCHYPDDAERAQWGRCRSAVDVPLGPGSGGTPSFRLVPADCSKCGTRACLLFVLLRWGVLFLLRLPQAPPAVWLSLHTSSLPACPYGVASDSRTSTSSCASVLSACALPTLWSERSPAGCGVDHAMKALGSAFGASVPDGRTLSCQCVVASST